MALRTLSTSTARSRSKAIHISATGGSQSLLTGLPTPTPTPAPPISSLYFGQGGLLNANWVMSFLGSSPSVAYVSFSVKPQTRAWPPRPLSPPSVFFFPLVMGLKPLASLHLAFSASCSFSTQNAAPWAPRLSWISYLLLCNESVRAYRLRATSMISQFVCRESRYRLLGRPSQSLPQVARSRLRASQGSEGEGSASDFIHVVAMVAGRTLFLTTGGLSAPDPR